MQFCMKLSVHEKAVVGSRWSLFTVVAKARFYCTCQHIQVKKKKKSMKVQQKVSAMKKTLPM